MGKEILLAVLCFIAAPSALAAECKAEIEQVTQQLGLPADAPATTESRGIPPEASSRLGGPVPGNPAATRRSEVLASLQAARAASAEGNEPECFAQLAKAQAVLKAR
jgi:hypothetical protein